MHTLIGLSFFLQSDFLLVQMIAIGSSIGRQLNQERLSKVEAVSEILRIEERSLAQGALYWLWARSEKKYPNTWV